MMLGAILQNLVKWVGPVFAAAGYPIIGGAVGLERSVFIGLIVPGYVILALGGIYAARGDLSLPWVIVIGILAAVTGESLGFWLGRRYGRSLVRRLPLVNRLEPRLEAAEDHFRKHGGKTVAIGRYATAAGAFVPFVAGLSKMPYRRFLAFDVPAIVVWAVAIVLVGYYLEGQLDLIDRILSRFGWIMLGLLAAIVAGRIVYGRWKKRRESERATSGS